MKTVLFVGAGRHQRRAIRRAKELGLRVAAIDRNPDAPGLDDADVAQVADFADIGAAVGDGDDVLGRAEKGCRHVRVRMQVAGPVECDDPNARCASCRVQPPSFASRRGGPVQVDRRCTGRIAELAVVNRPAIRQLRPLSHRRIIKRPYGFVK